MLQKVFSYLSQTTQRETPDTRIDEDGALRLWTAITQDDIHIFRKYYPIMERKQGREILLNWTLLYSSEQCFRHIAQQIDGLKEFLDFVRWITHYHYLDNPFRLRVLSLVHVFGWKYTLHYLFVDVPRERCSENIESWEFGRGSGCRDCWRITITVPSRQ
jgi:hypothetical protein